MNQSERLLFLTEAFLKESGEYSAADIPADTEGRKRVLRSLMNVRMPAALPEEVLRVQDEYLQQRVVENGIVDVSALPEVLPHICIWQGDITRLNADAIVNAANSQMLGCFVPMHTCIDNCIHTFAGTELRLECFEKMKELRSVYGQDYEQPTSVPMLTKAYNLPAKHVVHVVGPIVYADLNPSLEKALEDCYVNTLNLCLENSIRSVAFCCISTGVFRFPNRRAAEIAVNTVCDWLSMHEGAMDKVIFNAFKDEDKAYYEEFLH